MANLRYSYFHKFVQAAKTRNNSKNLKIKEYEEIIYLVIAVSNGNETMQKTVMIL